MKKRHISVMLLLWLLSQQVFAAISAVPDTGCFDHSETKTALNIANPAYAMLLLSSADQDSSHQQTSINCEHCNSQCQPLLIPNHVLLSAVPIYFPFIARSRETFHNAFVSSPFRPPIPA